MSLNGSKAFYADLPNAITFFNDFVLERPPLEKLHSMILRFMLKYNDRFCFFYSRDDLLVSTVKTHISKPSLNSKAQSLNKMADNRDPNFLFFYTSSILK